MSIFSTWCSCARLIDACLITPPRGERGLDEAVAEFAERLHEADATDGQMRVVPCNRQLEVYGMARAEGAAEQVRRALDDFADAAGDLADGIGDA
jgi:hypothetical protein